MAKARQIHPEFAAELAQKYGYDPRTTAVFETPEGGLKFSPNVNIAETAGEAFGKSALEGLGMAGVGWGSGALAGAGVGLLGGPAAPVTVPLAAVAGAIGGPILAKKLYRRLQSPESRARSEFQEQQYEREHPVASSLGNITGSLPMFVPGGYKALGTAAGKAINPAIWRTGKLTGEELANVIATASQAGMNVPRIKATLERDDLSWPEKLAILGPELGTIVSKPGVLGRSLHNVTAKKLGTERLLDPIQKAAEGEDARKAAESMEALKKADAARAEDLRRRGEADIGHRQLEGVDLSDAKLQEQQLGGLSHEKIGQDIRAKERQARLDAENPDLIDALKNLEPEKQGLSENPEDIALDVPTGEDEAGQKSLFDWQDPATAQRRLQLSGEPAPREPVRETPTDTLGRVDKLRRLQAAQETGVREAELVKKEAANRAWVEEQNRLQAEADKEAAHQEQLKSLEEEGRLKDQKEAEAQRQIENQRWVDEQNRLAEESGMKFMTARRLQGNEGGETTQAERLAAEHEKATRRATQEDVDWQMKFAKERGLDVRFDENIPRKPGMAPDEYNPGAFEARTGRILVDPNDPTRTVIPHEAGHGQVEVFRGGKRLAKSFAKEVEGFGEEDVATVMGNIARDSGSEGFLKRYWGDVKAGLKSIAGKGDLFDAARVLEANVRKNPELGREMLERAAQAGAQASGNKYMVVKYDPSFNLPKIQLPNDANEYMEIPLKPDYVSVKKKGESTFGDLVKHPLLYKAVPNLARLKVKFEPTGQGSMYSPLSRDINVDTSPGQPRDEIKTSLLHEGGHAVADEQGLPMGSNPNALRDRANYQAQQNINAVTGALHNLGMTAEAQKVGDVARRVYAWQQANTDRPPDKAMMAKVHQEVIQAVGDPTLAQMVNNELNNMVSSFARYLMTQGEMIVEGGAQRDIHRSEIGNRPFESHFNESMSKIAAKSMSEPPMVDFATIDRAKQQMTTQPKPFRAEDYKFQTGRRRRLQPNEPAPDQPTAEPLDDLRAQMDTLGIDPRRAGVYIPRESMQRLIESDQFDQLSGGYPVEPNFDGKGGAVVFATDYDRTHWTRLRDAGHRMQLLLGQITGAGEGKPAEPVAVAQTQDEAGNVVRDRVVGEGEQIAPGEVVKTPQEVEARRQAGLARETIQRLGEPLMVAWRNQMPSTLEGVTDPFVAIERAKKLHGNDPALAARVLGYHLRDVSNGQLNREQAVTMMKSLFDLTPEGQPVRPQPGSQGALAAVTEGESTGQLSKGYRNLLGQLNQGKLMERWRASGGDMPRGANFLVDMIAANRGGYDSVGDLSGVNQLANVIRSAAGEIGVDLHIDSAEDMAKELFSLRDSGAPIDAEVVHESTQAPSSTPESREATRIVTEIWPEVKEAWAQRIPYTMTGVTDLPGAITAVRRMYGGAGPGEVSTLAQSIVAATSRSGNGYQLGEARRIAELVLGSDQSTPVGEPPPISLPPAKPTPPPNARPDENRMLSEGWQDIAAEPGRFRYGRLGERARPPGTETWDKVMSEYSTPKRKLTYGNQTVMTPEGEMNISEGPKKVGVYSVDAGSSGKEEGGGGQAYQGIMTYAKQTGKAYQPSSLTTINQLRAVSNAVSSALRHGTTEHLKMGNYVDNWVEGDHVNNIAELVRTESELSHERIPNLNNLTIDEHGNVMTKDGEAVDNAKLLALIKENDPAMARGDTKGLKGVGVTTAKRAIMTREMLSEEGLKGVPKGQLLYQSAIRKQPGEALKGWSRSVLDAASNEADAKGVASFRPTLRRFYAEKFRLQGIGNKAIDRMIREDRTVLKSALDKRNEAYKTGTTPSYSSDELRAVGAFHNALVQYQVENNKVPGRGGGFDPNYTPHMISMDSLAQMVRDPAHRAKVLKDVVDENMRVDPSNIPSEIEEHFHEYFRALSAGEQPGDFSALTKRARRYILSDSLRETDGPQLMDRYARRASRDIARASTIEQVPEVADLLHIGRDLPPGAVKPDKFPITPEMANQRDDVYGNLSNPAYSDRKFYNFYRGLQNATTGSLIQTMTGVRNLLQIPGQVGRNVKSLGDLQPIIEGLFKPLVDYHGTRARTVESGAYAPSHASQQIGAEEPLIGSLSKNLSKVGDVMRMMTGSKKLEELGRVLNYSIGEQLAARHLGGTSKANKDFLERFGQNLAPTDSFQEKVSKVAANYTRNLQTSYSGEDVPAWMLRPTGRAAAFRLMKYGMANYNRTIDSVVKPAYEGNYLPLLLMVGGGYLSYEAIEKMNEYVTGAQGNRPSLKEIDKGMPKEDQAKRMGEYALNILDAADKSGTFGAASQLLGQVGRNIRGQRTQIGGNPEYEVVKNLGMQTAQAVKRVGMGDDPIDALTDALKGAASSTVQDWRLVENLMQSNEEKTERADARNRSTFGYLSGHDRPTATDILSGVTLGNTYPPATERDLFNKFYRAEDRGDIDSSFKRLAVGKDSSELGGALARGSNYPGMYADTRNNQLKNEELLKFLDETQGEGKSSEIISKARDRRGRLRSNILKALGRE